MTMNTASLSDEQTSHLSEARGDGVLAQQWPRLSHAMSRYDERTAERFSQLAYEAVEAGLIRFAERQRLAAEAESLGIRPFDAQLLIACAVRKWVLDRRYDPTPSRRAPALSFEYKSFQKTWIRIALVLMTAAIVDGIILVKWLG